jgi:branched-chain amino acid transport system permease protein
LTHILEFLVLGLGPGALIAGIALGIVLTYRGCGAINLATGAVAVLGAFVFYGLKSSGYLFLPPLPFAPHRIQLGGPWAVAPSVLVALGVCGLTGVLIQLFVWRPLRQAAPLAKLVASLGVFLAIQSVVVLRFGEQGQLAPPVFPSLETGSVDLFGARVPPDRLVLFGIVVLVGIVLSLVYKYTRFGLATRAAQESEANALLAGLSPQRLSMINTVLAALICGALGIMAASQTQLDPVTIPLTVIPALGAALLARFTSFQIAVVAGVALGVLQSEIGYLQTLSWFPTDLASQPLPGVDDLVFFVVIVVAMLWRGSSLPERGALVERRLPAAPAAKRLAPGGLAISAALTIAFLVAPFDYRQALINSLIGTILCLSLVVLTGFVGQISLLQVGLAGVAGFVVSRVGIHLGIGFPLAMIIGCCAAVAIGMISAVPALRVRGVNLAIVTLAAAQALDTFWFENARWGGGLASLNVSSPHLFSLNLGPTASFPINASEVPSPVFGLVCAAFAVTTGLLVASLRRSDLGQRMLAVRSNERAAAAAGISVRNVKLSAFAISSLIAGVAGALYAYNFGSVSSDRFQVLLALSFIAFAYLGGITSVKGAALAGLGVTEGLLGHALNKEVGIPDTYQLLIGGLTLIVVVVRYPGGLASAPTPLFLRRLGRRAVRASPVRTTGAAASEQEPKVVEVTK